MKIPRRSALERQQIESKFDYIFFFFACPRGVVYSRETDKHFNQFETPTRLDGTPHRRYRVGGKKKPLAPVVAKVRFHFRFRLR